MINRRKYITLAETTCESCGVTAHVPDSENSLQALCPRCWHPLPVPERIPAPATPQIRFKTYVGPIPGLSQILSKQSQQKSRQQKSSPTPRFETLCEPYRPVAPKPKPKLKSKPKPSPKSKTKLKPKRKPNRAIQRSVQQKPQQKTAPRNRTAADAANAVPLLKVSQQPEEVLTWKLRLQKAWSSYGLSLVLHAAALLIAALWIIHADDPFWFEPITASFEEVESESLVEVATPLELPNPEDEIAKLFTPDDLSSVAELDRDAINVPVEEFGDSPSGGKGLDGLGSRSGGGGAGFFGAQAQGKSFVFIVDISTSMLASFDNNPANFSQRRRPASRWTKAREELLESIKGLNNKQEFCVFLYNENFISYPFKPRMIKASSRVKTNVARWAYSVNPSGGTDPRRAISWALNMKPDAIFFLTDGAIPQDTRNVALRDNKSKTVIHTISIGLQRNPILEIIAEDHGGTFRGVGFQTPPYAIASNSPSPPIVPSQGSFGFSPSGNQLPGISPKLTNSTPNASNAPLKPLNLICFVDRNDDSFSRYLSLEKRLASVKSKLIRANLPWDEYEDASLIMHNSAIEVAQFGKTLQEFLKTSNGGNDSDDARIPVGLLGLDIPLEEIKTSEVKAMLKSASFRSRSLESVLRLKTLEGFSHEVAYIYVFGDPQSRRELINALEIFNLYNGSKLKIIDGYEALK